MDYEDEGPVTVSPYLSMDVSKARSLTRRPTCFSDQPAVMLDELMPDRSLELEYVRRVKMCRNIQTGSMMLFI